MKKRLFNQKSEPGSRIAATAQRLSVKARIMMALFALMLFPMTLFSQGTGTYDLKIGGIQVYNSSTDLSKDATFSSSSIITVGSAGSVVFDNSSLPYKLYLIDATISGNVEWGGDDNLIIELGGVNTINGNIICSNGSYYLTFSKNQQSSSCSLTINSSVGVAATSVISGFSDVWYTNGVYLASANPVAYDGSKMLDYQYINYPSDLTTMTLKSDQIYHRIWVGGSQVTESSITSTADLDYSGSPSSNVADTKTLSLTNYSVNAPIVSDLDNLTILFSGANMIGDNSPAGGGGGYIRNIHKGDVALTIGSVTSGSASTLGIGNSVGYEVIKGFYPLTLNGVYAAYGSPMFFDTTNKCYMSRGNSIASNFTITTTPTYMLWVGSIGDGFTQAIEGNLTNYYNNIQGGTVTFSGTDNTLTLDAATIGGDIESSLGDLTVNLKGSSTIIHNSYGGAVAPFVSTNDGAFVIKREDATGSLKFEGVAYTATEPVSGFSSVTYTTPLTLNNNKSEVSEAYNLWIGDVQVTSANMDDLFTAKGDSVASYYSQYAITFNPTTSTLTLYNVTLDVGIYSELPNLKIYLKGANTISNTSRDCAFWTKTTGGNLTFECESGATLDMHSNSPYSVIQGFNTVNYAAGTYLSSPTVPALYGFNGNKNLVDCTWTGMTTNLCSAVITSVEQYQLWIDDTQITAANAGNVFNDGKVSYNAASKTLYLNGVSYLNPIFSGLDALTIEFNGTNSLGNSSGYNGYVMSSDPTADLKFKLGTTGNGTLSLYESVGRSVICGFASVTLDGVVYLDASAVYDTTIRQMKSGSYTATNLSIGVQSYPLWVGSTQLTSSNAGNVFNDGTVSYVHDATNNTGTLTLNGATLNGGDISTSMSDLTIHVKGNNKISAASNCIRSSATTPGKLTFTKDTGGKLELDNASNGYSVIKGFNDVDGVPLETKAPYEIYTDGNYYRLKQLFVAAGDTASIDNVWVYADTTYPLWVDGSQATSVSANNILGDAGSTASFNSNTLTLNVANIPGAIVSSLTSTLTISVKGNSTVSGGIFQTSNATAGLEITKDANAAGNVSLIVNPGREAAIRGFSSFTYTDFVPFNSSGTTDLSDGISYDNSKALKYNGTALGAVYLLSKTDLATTGLTFTMASVAYTGAAVVLPTTVTMDDGTTQTALTQTTDYTVTGYKASDKTALPSAPIAAGNYYATIQGNGIYKGTADAAFTIDQADFTKITLTIDAITGLTYTGSEIKPTPTVTFGTTPLVAGTDFDYSYANNTNAALSTATPAPTVTITGKGNYTGEKNVKFTINPVDFYTSTAIDVAAIDNQTYTGSEIKPTPTVTFNGNSLTAGTDFRYDYSNNLNVADKNDNSAPTVTIIGLGGNFLNGSTKSKTFTIEQASLATATINPIDPQTFTGSEIKPTPIVTFNGKTLTAGTDFNYGYANNTNAAKSADTSAPTVTVTGKGNFTGTALTKFTINPLAATPDVVLTIPTSYVYDGTAKTPAVAVSVSGVALTTDDYSVAYTDNVNAGRAAAKATVTLKRNYSGSKVETFDINPLTATLSWGNTTFVYNGTAQAPTATVTNLVGTDVCNVTVGGAEIAAGSYTATATALSNANYQLPASPTTTFTILDRTATIDFGDRTFKTYYDANETFIVPDGTTAYIVTGVSGNAVTIQKVSYIKAGIPVLLESTPGSTVAKNASDTFTGNLLKYAAAATPATEKHYLLYKNEFVRASGTISNKVYLDLAGYNGGARSLVIGDGATAIEGIVIDEEDGDAKWYDMQGRRINKPTKAGLYIKDGQKVVVKTRY